MTQLHFARLWVVARLTAHFEHVVVLLLNLRRVNTETVEDGSLQDSLRFIALLRQHHKQRGKHEQPDHVKDERLAREAVEDLKNRPDALRLKTGAAGWSASLLAQRASS